LGFDPRARNDAAGSTQVQYPLAARPGEALGVRGRPKVILELADFSCIKQKSLL
jgi:hypothetical protein